MSSTPTPTITYKLNVVNNAEKGGLVLDDLQNITYESNNIDESIVDAIMNSIKNNQVLSTLVSNRSDTTSGTQATAVATTILSANNSNELNQLLHKSNNEGRLQILDDLFTNTLTTPIIFNNNNFDYPAIPTEETFLPNASAIIITNRYNSLKQSYQLLMTTIKNENLIKIGKYNDDMIDTYDPNDYVGNVIDIENVDNKMKNLVNFLFLVAKTFMRVPIVLLTMATEYTAIEGEKTNRSAIDINKFDKCLEYYKELKNSIYHDDIRDNKIFQKIITLTRQKANYYDHIPKNSKNETVLSIDIICFILTKIIQLNINVNYKYMILFVCERLIYIINYWCSTQTNQTTQFASSKLGELHNTEIKTTYINKFNGDPDVRNRTFASILQKLHNTNDNLLTFVKIRKGKTALDPENPGKTMNDGKTMNIRYAGFGENNKLTQDNAILAFKYDDNPQSFYQDYAKIFENGEGAKATILYKPYNDARLKTIDATYKEQKITTDLLTNTDPKYNHVFNLGPFTYIFEEDKTNKQIAESKIFVEKIVNKLITNGDPISIIGYGSSGSGKTSVLIQLSAPNKPPEPGILMFLSNELGNKDYTKCNVKIIEFGKLGSEDETKNKADMSTFGTGGTNYPGDPNDEAFICDYKYNENSWDPVNLTFSMSNEKYRSISMFSDILYFMDYQRHIKTTPNNPVSSRSHVIISLTYENTSKEKRNLFICDLAGVENEFDCNEIKDTDYWRTLYETAPNVPKDDRSSTSAASTSAPAAYGTSTSAAYGTSTPPPQQVIATSAPAAYGTSTSAASTSAPTPQQVIATPAPAAYGTSTSAASTSAPAASTSAPAAYGTLRPHDVKINMNRPNNTQTRSFVEGKKTNCKSLSNYITTNLTNFEGYKKLAENISQNGFIIENNECPIGKYFNIVKKYIVGKIETPTNNNTNDTNDIIKKLDNVFVELSKINIVTLDGSCLIILVEQFNNLNYNAGTIIPNDQNCLTTNYTDTELDFNTLFKQKIVERLIAVTDLVTLSETMRANKIKTLAETIDQFKIDVRAEIMKVTTIRKKDNTITRESKGYIDKIIKINLFIDTFKYDTIENAKKNLETIINDRLIKKVKSSSSLKQASIITKSNLDQINFEELKVTVGDVRHPEGSTLEINEEVDRGIPSNLNFKIRTYDNYESGTLQKMIEIKYREKIIIDQLLYNDTNYKVSTHINIPIIEIDPIINIDTNPNNKITCYKYKDQYFKSKEDAIKYLIAFKKNFKIKINTEYLRSTENDNLFSNTTNFSHMELVNELYTLKFPTENLPSNSKAPTPFLFYLKTNFLNEFKSEYNTSQLQVMFEQIRFYKEYVYDNLDDSQKKKSSNGGGSLITHYPTKLSPLVSMENLSIPTLSLRDRSGITQYGGLDQDGMRTNCIQRINEGKYINNFLKEMREGIAKYTVNIAKNKKKYPPFFTKCLPLQCNPEFKECLGIDDYNPLQVIVKDTKSDSYGELVDKIREICELSKQDKIVFCVFCVINFSEPPLVTEPPPVPYIDLTVLQQHYKKLENMVIANMNTDTQITLVKKSVESVFDSVPENKKNLLNENLNTLRTSIKDENDINTILKMVKVIISGFSNINAATPIGTLLFTDSVAKNFIEVNTCNIGSSYLEYKTNKKGGSKKKNNKTRSTRTFLNRTISAKK